MKRKGFLTCAILGSIVFITSVSACGVSTTQYTAVVNEKAVTEAQLTAARSDLDKMQNEKAAVETQLTSARVDLEKMKTELESTKSQLQKANAELTSLRGTAADASSKVTQLRQTISKAKVLADINAGVFVPSLKGVALTQTEQRALGFMFLQQVATSGDSKLQGLLQAWVDSNFAVNRGLEMFLYIFETLPKILE